MGHFAVSPTKMISAFRLMEELDPRLGSEDEVKQREQDDKMPTLSQKFSELA